MTQDEERLAYAIKRLKLDPAVYAAHASVISHLTETLLAFTTLRDFAFRRFIQLVATTVNDDVYAAVNSADEALMDKWGESIENSPPDYFRAYMYFQT